MYVSEDDIDVFEISIDSFNIFFNGYINDDILSKIERYGIFPINDQIVKADLSSYEDTPDQRRRDDRVNTNQKT